MRLGLVQVRLGRLSISGGGGGFKVAGSGARRR